MPTVKNEDKAEIAKWHNKLSDRSADSINNFCNALLTIFTPVTSGLVFLTTSLEFQSAYQRYVFTAVITLSGLIVLLSLTQKYVKTLVAGNIYKQFIEYFNKTGKPYSQQLRGKSLPSILLRIIPFTLYVLLVCNIISMLLFAYSFIF